MNRRTRIKICCIASVDEARLAITHGADAIGLVSAMPSGPGPIPDATIAAIARQVPPPVATFLLTCRTAPADVVAHVRACGRNVVQLVDAVPATTYQALREACPAVKIVQVIHVAHEGSLAEAARAAGAVDALLLDSGRPDAAVRELGGTGRVHDWALSRRIVAASPVPVFLAGGLRPDNVAAAIAQVRPYAVDVCSGLRTDGALDAAKVREFVGAVRGQDAGEA